MANAMEKPEKRKLTAKEYIEQLEKELNSAKCMLWAAIKTAGGRVDIPNSVMEMLGGDLELLSRYDPKKEITIIEAKEKTIITKPH